MMNRWLLACLLALCCSLAVGCSGDDEKADAPPNTAKEETQGSKDAKANLETVKTSLTNAREAIKRAQGQVKPATVTAKPASNTNQRAEKLSKSSSSTVEQDAPTTTKQLQDQIDIATTEMTAVISRPLEDLESALTAQPETEETSKLVQIVSTVEKLVADAVQELKAASTALKETPAEQRPNLDESLKAALAAVGDAKSAADNIKIPDNLETSSNSWLALLPMSLLWWVGVILGSIVGLVLLLAMGRALLSASAARADSRINRKIQPLASSIQKQQTEVASQITALTTTQNELQTRIADLEFELKRVAKVARDAAHDGAGRRLPTPQPAFSSFEEPIERDEPVFPISIGDYLTKMRRSSNIVRPDFQNDILVNDPDGTGELILIRDAAIPDDLQPLFVVPRATQFQTKQDFYTYYQKYYECDRPSAGDVWIIDPAVVSKVFGGWQLREKGVLEVR